MFDLRLYIAALQHRLTGRLQGRIPRPTTCVRSWHTSRCSFRTGRPEHRSPGRTRHAAWATMYCCVERFDYRADRQPFRIDITGTCEDHSTPSTRSSAQNVYAQAHLVDGTERYWNGYVTPSAQSGQGRTPSAVRAGGRAVAVVPDARVADCRMYQNQTRAGHHQVDLQDGGFSDFEMKLSGLYRTVGELRPVPRDRLQLRPSPDGTGRDCTTTSSGTRMPNTSSCSATRRRSTRIRRQPQDQVPPQHRRRRRGARVHLRLDARPRPPAGCLRDDGL